MEAKLCQRFLEMLSKVESLICSRRDLLRSTGASETLNEKCFNRQIVYLYFISKSKPVFSLDLHMEVGASTLKGYNFTLITKESDIKQNVFNKYHFKNMSFCYECEVAPLYDGKTKMLLKLVNN